MRLRGPLLRQHLTGLDQIPAKGDGAGAAGPAAFADFALVASTAERLGHPSCRGRARGSDKSSAGFRHAGSIPRSVAAAIEQFRSAAALSG